MDYTKDKEHYNSKTIVEAVEEICFKKNISTPYIPADLRGIKITETSLFYLEGIKEIYIFNDIVSFNSNDLVVNLIK